jgi:Ca2+/Na+ antiporter
VGNVFTERWLKILLLFGIKFYFEKDRACHGSFLVSVSVSVSISVIVVAIFYFV